MLKRLCMAFALLVICLLASAEAEKKLTLMIYMPGSDLESRAGAASADLEEMRAAMAGAEDLNVAVMTGGASEWQSDIPADSNVIWRITDAGMQELAREPGRSMGDPAALRWFLRRAMETLPARRYALILWDHGGGPLNGVCFDERADMDSLSLDELSRAFSESGLSGDPLLFIGFDACLMATAEVACAVAPYAEYMIASQEPEPASGWSYGFLRDLAKTENGEEAGRLIVDCYAESLRDAMTPYTLSCLRLGGIDALKREIGRLFGGLRSRMDEETYYGLASSRVDAKTLGSAAPNDWDLVDLADYADMLQENGLADASPLREALDGIVVCSCANEPYVNGLSIYAPFDNKPKYVSPWSVRYDSLDFSEEYREYTRSFARLWMGSSRVSWRGGAAAQAVEQEHRQRVSIRLTEEEAADVARARLLILEEMEDEYRLMYAVDGLTPAHGELTAAYRDEALYLLDDGGEILAGPLVWRPVSGASASGEKQGESGIATFGLMETAERQLEGLYLTWQPGENGLYEMAECYTLNEAMDMYTVSARGLCRGDSVNFGGYLRRFPDQDAAYEQWKPGETLAFSPIRYTGETGWHLAFLPMQSTSDRVAVFEITDYQANVHLSAPIRLENTSRLSVLDAPQTREGGGLELTLQSASLYTDANAELQLEFALRNGRGENVTVNMETVMLDGKAMFDFYAPRYLRFADGETQTMRLTIDGETFQELRVRHMQKLRVSLGIQKKYQPLESVWFDFDLPVYLGMLSPDAPGEREPLAEFEQEGVWFALTDIRFDEYGDLVGEIHAVNRSGKEKRILDAGCRVNGTALLGSLTSKGTAPYVLPADSESWFRFHIYTHDYVDGKKVRLVPISDLSDIRQISFTLRMEYAGTFDLVGNADER